MAYTAVLDRLMVFLDAYYQEKFEDTQEVIISRESKDRQHNGQKKKYKRTNNDLQYITQKTKECATRTPLKPRTHTGSPVG